MIDMVNQSSSEIQTTLKEEAASVGYTLSDNMQSIWSTSTASITDVVTTYGGQIANSLTTLNSTISNINSNVSAMMSSLNKSASSSTKTATSSSSTTNSKATTPTVSSATSTKSTSSSSSNSSSNSGWGSWFIYQKSYYPKDKLNKDVSITDRLAYFDFKNDFATRKTYYAAMGGSGTYTGSAKQNTWMISEMKSHGYQHGGTIGDLIGQTGEDGFVLARTGEEILSLEKIKALGEAFTKIDSVLDTIDHIHSTKSANLPKLGEAPSVDNINFEVVLPNVESYSDFKHEMQHDKNFESMIQDMTINRLFNGSSLKKYKYN